MSGKSRVNANVLLRSRVISQSYRARTQHAHACANHVQDRVDMTNKHTTTTPPPHTRTDPCGDAPSTHTEPRATFWLVEKALVSFTAFSAATDLSASASARLALALSCAFCCCSSDTCARCWRCRRVRVRTAVTGAGRQVHAHALKGHPHDNQTTNEPTNEPTKQVDVEL